MKKQTHGSKEGKSTLTRIRQGVEHAARKARGAVTRQAAKAERKLQVREKPANSLLKFAFVAVESAVKARLNPGRVILEMANLAEAKKNQASIEFTTVLTFPEGCTDRGDWLLADRGGNLYVGDSANFPPEFVKEIGEYQDVRLSAKKALLAGIKAVSVREAFEWLLSAGDQDPDTLHQLPLLFKAAVDAIPATIITDAKPGEREVTVKVSAYSVGVFTEAALKFGCTVEEAVGKFIEDGDSLSEWIMDVRNLQ